MEPIISPWIIYAIDVANKVYMLAALVTLLSIAVTVISGVCIIEDDDITAKKAFKYSVMALIVAVPILILIPSKDTMFTMLALHYVTPDNVQVVQGNIIDFVGQIAQAVKAAK